MPDTNEEQVKPFAATLQELAKGEVHAELSAALADLTAAVVETGKKGTLQLTLTVDTVGKHADNLAVTAQVKSTPPKPGIPPTVFFADEGGNLLRHDPRQPTLPLREVGTTTEERSA